MKMLFYRIYQFVIMLPVLVVATIVTSLVTIAGVSIGAGKWAGYWPQHLWARFFCIMTLVRVTVKGREHVEKGRGYVFVANHQGAYDIFSIAGYLNHNFRWMMKASLRRIPLVGLACEKAHQIYVDSSSGARLRRTMERAEGLLREGMSLVVFPEGARTFTGKMGRFKKGAFSLATEFSLPVVPITISGAFEVMPRTARLPKWGHITLTIHEPIEADPEKGHDLTELMEASAAAVASGLRD